MNFFIELCVGMFGFLGVRRGEAAGKMSLCIQLRRVDKRSASTKDSMVDALRLSTLRAAPLCLTLPREGGGNQNRVARMLIRDELATRHEPSRIALRFIRATPLIAMLVFAGGQAACAADMLSLTPAQLASLGVRFEAPVAMSGALGSVWSGLVSVPPQGFEQVVAPLAGRVLRVSAAAGDEVAAGQVLLTMFSPEWVALAQAVRSAQASENLAAQTLAREQRLWKEGIGIERRVREAEVALQQARIEREAAAAHVLGAGGSLDKNVSSTAELAIRAPRAGRVLSLQALPGAALMAGEGVASLSSTDARWVEADVPLSEANALRLGQVATLDAGLGAPLSGRVLAIGPVVEAARQTVSVRLAVENAAVLRPGLRVSVRFVAEGQAGGWRVPRAALVQVDGALALFVKRGDKVLPLAVTSQGMSEAQPAITAAFVPGDQVAVEGAVLLKGAWDGRSSGGAAQ